MKTELIIPESKPELKFPLLATSKRDGQTVLFTAEHSGTALSPNKLWSLGRYGNDWVSVHDEGNWTIHPPGTQLILTVE